MAYPDEIDAVAAVPSPDVELGTAHHTHHSALRAAVRSIRDALGAVHHPIVPVTQAEYDLLTPDANTLYVIVAGGGDPGAVTAVHKATGGSNAGGTSALSPEITCTAGRLLLAAVGTANGSVAAADKPVVSGLNATWVEVADVAFGGSSRFRLTMYRAVLDSDETGQLTVTTANAMASHHWSIVEFEGAATGTAGEDGIVQAQANSNGGSSTTSLSVTLGAFADPANATFGVLMTAASSTSVSPGAGFLELGEDSTSRTIQSQWRDDNDTTVDWTWSGNAANGGIAVEIAAGA